MNADNGKLYGMTHSEGLYDFGVLFEWNPAKNTFTTKMNFNGAENGGYPYGSLIQADNGKLYGMAGGGGENGMGVLFEWDTLSDTYTKIIDFNGTDYGSNPYASLVQADNGKIYGMTYRGGSFEKGVLFEWDPVTHVFIKKLDFNGSEKGSNPSCTLIQATNGKLYGMTKFGGVNDCGVLFEWDPANDTYTKKIDFGEENGLYPRGSLMQAINGKIYGMTSLERINDVGSFFEWDPVTGILIRKTGNNNGNKSYIQHPGKQVETRTNEENKDLSLSDEMVLNGGFIEIVAPAQGTLNAEACDSFTSPSGKYCWKTTGIYKDTVPGAGGYDSIITVNLTISSANVSVTQDNSVLTANASEATYQWISCDNGNTSIEGETHTNFQCHFRGQLCCDRLPKWMHRYFGLPVSNYDRTAG